MLNIAWALPEDAEALLQCKIDSFAIENALYGKSPPDYDSLEHLQRSLSSPRIRYYKIMGDDRIIGGICVCILGDGHYRIGGLYIAQGYQDRGVGTRAMNKLLGEFPDAVKWTLETPYRSIRNHHFYEKLGFRKVGETEPEPDGFYLYLYEKLV